MIDFVSRPGDAVVTIRNSGIVSADQIARAVTRLAATLSGAPPVRVLFDWRNVRQWPCEPLPEGVEALCHSGAHLITRAAIVHSHRQNRQAAWLAALLRLRNTSVRSWRPEALDPAMVWLTDPIPRRVTGPSGHIRNLQDRA